MESHYGFVTLHEGEERLTKVVSLLSTTGSGNKDSANEWSPCVTALSLPW